MDVVRFVAKLYVFDDVFTCFIRVVVVGVVVVVFNTACSIQQRRC